MAKRIIRPQKGEAGPPARRRPSERHAGARFRDELQRLWERVFGEPPRDLFRPSGWAPSVDVIDGDREVTVRAELPGLEPDDVQVTASGGVLTLAGEKKETREERKDRFTRSETRWGVFRRTFALPPGADPDQAEATFERGVLTVRIPKRESEAPRRIRVSGRTRDEPRP